MEERKGNVRLLVVGDGGVTTGFARVVSSIVENLPENYDIHHVAINYNGDPYPVSHKNHKLYPARLGGDLLGVGRFSGFVEIIKPDVIFIINDPWLTKHYLEAVKYDEEILKKIVLYIPVDATYLQKLWFKGFDKLGAVVAYTEFGKNEILRADNSFDVKVIPHGVDSGVFYPYSREQAKMELGLPEDLFIVLNANRNQPRKRIDLTIRSFARFAKGKPENVKLYLHMGIQDEGWHLPEMAIRYGIDDRLILTSSTLSPLNGVTNSRLNTIYNACEIGLNTSHGEGWGLINIEHAITKSAQIVPDSSACREIFSDCGILTKCSTEYTNPSMLTVGAVVDEDSVVQALETLYADKSLRDSLSEKAFNKFTQDKYSWKTIAKEWFDLFEKIRLEQV